MATRTKYVSGLMAISLLAFMGYGFVTDYLGYGFTRIDASDTEIPIDAAEHRVKRIVDGDTVHMKDGTKVRLYGIDTPERDQHHGIHAAAKLVARGHQIGMTDSAVLKIKPHVAGAQRASFNRRFAQARARFFELVGHGHGCLLIILFVIVRR